MGMTCPRRCLRAAVALVAIALQYGPGGRCAPAEESSWGSPRIGTVERAWALLGGLATPSKTEFVRAMYLQRQLLRTCLSDEDLRQLAASCDSLPARDKDRSRFANDVLALMVKVFVHSGDWDHLTRLLSTRCPRYMDNWVSIQFYLATHRTGRKQSVLALGDAYEKCQVSAVRRDLAGAIRRAFAGLAIEGRDDAEYVRNAMLWYVSHKESMLVNDLYVDDEALDDPEDSAEDYATKPLPWTHGQLLFKKIEAAQGTPVPKHAPTQSERGEGETSGFAPPGSDNASTKTTGTGGLNGKWEAVLSTRDGQRLTPPVPRRLDLGMDRGRWIGTHNEVMFSFRVRLSSSTEPHAIDFLQTDGWETGVTISAIYELRGDSLRLGLPDGNDQWLRPTSFKAEPGSCETVITFKRLTE
jgi:uncharacterized protein (TIGR03067 family)